MWLLVGLGPRCTPGLSTPWAFSPRSWRPFHFLDQMAMVWGQRQVIRPSGQGSLSWAFCFPTARWHQEADFEMGDTVLCLGTGRPLGSPAPRKTPGSASQVCAETPGSAFQIACHRASTQAVNSHS